MFTKNAKLDNQARKVAYNVIKFCDEEKRIGFKIPVDRPTERASRLLGLSRSTVIRIRKEGKEADKRALKALSENNFNVITNADDIDTATELTEEPLWLGGIFNEMTSRVKEEPVSDGDLQSEESFFHLCSEMESDNSDLYTCDKEITTKIEIDENAWLERINERKPQIDVLNADLETKNGASSMNGIEEQSKNGTELHSAPTESTELHTFKFKTRGSTSIAKDVLDSKDCTQKKEDKYAPRNKCEADADNVSVFNAEKKAHSPKSKRSFKCEVCGKTFRMRCLLRKHKVIHGDLRPHKCKVCDKSFIKRSHLNAHTLYHEGKRSHCCEICGKSFISSSDLKRHSLVHEGKKPYRCEICSKTFVLASRLKEHKMTHEGEKPYQCEICDKRFMRISDKRKHYLIIHQNSKNNTSRRCEICNKDFSKPSELKRHNFMHGAKKPYKCEVCEKSYCRLSTLKNHSLTHTHHSYK